MSEQVQGQKSKSVKRDDPPPRPVDGVVTRGDVEGKDPAKHYVWVSEVNDPTFNIGHYRSLGYKVSQYDPSEAKPTFGFEEFQQGDAIKANGMVLMECPIERKREIEQKGWSVADRIEETIKRRDIDPLTPDEQARFRGIKSVRTEQDDRARWQF